MGSPSFFSRYGHHSGTILGIVIIIIAIWFLHSTGIFSYVLTLGILLILAAVAVHFYKRRQFMKEYGELPSSTAPTRPPYGGFGAEGEHSAQPYQQQPYQQQPYQAASGYPPYQGNYPPSATPQSAPYQGGYAAGYENPATPYAPPGGPRAYNYNV